MNVVFHFYDKDTKEILPYTPDERLQMILEDWETKNKQEDLTKYKVYLDKLKPDTKDKIVLDLGCGAFGGILSLIEAKEKIAIDPLIDHYKKINVWSYDGDYMVSDAKKISLPDNYADCIFCLNALDHCFHPKNSIRIVGEIKRLLKPRGKLYIHVHLRTIDQLNVMHLYGIEEKDLDKWFDDMKKVMWEIEDNCIVWDRPYKTFWGILEK